MAFSVNRILLSEWCVNFCASAGVKPLNSCTATCPPDVTAMNVFAQFALLRAFSDILSPCFIPAAFHTKCIMAISSAICEYVHVLHL